MKKALQKAFSVIVFAVFGYVVATELVGSGGFRKRPTVLQEISVEQSAKMYTDLGGSGTAVPVIVFVTSWCGVCRALEKELTASGVQFIQADVEESNEALLYYQSVTMGRTRGVPVTVVGTKVFLGYKLAQILDAIKDV